MEERKNDPTFRMMDYFRHRLRPDQTVSAALTAYYLMKSWNNQIPDSDEEAFVAGHRIADAHDISFVFSNDNRRDLIAACAILGDYRNIDFESLLGTLYRSVKKLTMPESLLELYRSQFRPDTHTVLIAEGEHFIPFLGALVYSSPDAEFVITSEDLLFIQVARVMFEDNKRVHIRKASIYEFGFDDRQYDLIFSIPAFGRRTKVDREADFICRDYEYVALENLCLHLENGKGRMIITLPMRFTFAGNEIRQLRNFIMDTYSIDEIDELPENFFQATSIRTCLLAVRSGDPDEISVRRFSFEKKGNKADKTQLITKDENITFIDEVREQDNWFIDRLLGHETAKSELYKNLTVKTELLGNVATVFRGKAVSNNKSNTGTIGVLNISDIGQYEIDYSNLQYIESDERSVANYILKEDDIILPSRGTAIRVGVFDEQSVPIIASLNLVVVRPKDGSLDCYYLKSFLESPVGIELIKELQQGSSVMNLSYKDLMSLEIPFPPIEEQRAIGDKYRTGLLEYKKSIEEASKKWQETLDEVHRAW